MRYLIILFLLVSIPCFAEVNEKYSYKAYPYHELSFKDRPASEFSNTTIIGSCFFQENKPNSDIFPDGMIGVTFEKCNLDNIYIPFGNVVVGGTKQMLKVQNDLSDWILDNSLKPTEPMDKELRLEKSISVDPIDIPLTKQEQDVFEKADISN